MEPPNNGHVGNECFVHYLEFVPSSEVLTCIQLLAGGMQFVHCREVVLSSECPLSEVPLYIYIVGLLATCPRSGENAPSLPPGFENRELLIPMLDLVVLCMREMG